MRRTAMLAAALLLTACAGREPARPPVAVGEGRLAVPGGSIWYRVAGTGTERPVVLLHGGPGLSSFYLKPFDDLGDERPVVRYDQLGGGKSDTTSDTTLFTIAHFVAELDSLRAALGIQRWHVLGHSWGTILAVEYYRAFPERVISLSFGSPVFDVPAFEAHARTLVATLSDSAQRYIRAAERAQRYDGAGYQNAMNEFYGRYVWLRPVQADLDSTFASMNQSIYVYMQGPSEFTITGTLKPYTAVSLLPQISVPTLVTVGEFDEVGPDIVRAHAAMIPGARFVQLAGAAHLTPWDAREEHLRVMREHLRAADSVEAARR